MHCGRSVFLVILQSIVRWDVPTDLRLMIYVLYASVDFFFFKLHSYCLINRSIKEHRSGCPLVSRPPRWCQLNCSNWVHLQEEKKPYVFAVPRVPNLHNVKTSDWSLFPRCWLCFCWHCAHTGEGIFSISFKEAKLFESFEITRRLGLVITNVKLANDRKESASVLNTKCCT